MQTCMPKRRIPHLICGDLLDFINPDDPLIILSKKIPWKEFDKAFASKYSKRGRPAKSTRLMVGLLMLKHLYNLSDAKVVQMWTQNPYFQAFCGESRFRWSPPCAPSELTHFRKRIGEDGVKKIFEISAQLHKDKIQEKEIVVDTTVQEKNITFPTDTKLMCKIISKCRKIAKEEGIVLRRSFRRELPELLKKIRFNKRSKDKKKVKKARKRIKTIAGILIREIKRKLPEDVYPKYVKQIELFEKVHSQKKKDKNKIYSLHEPGVYCISKGKEHKKYEFGSKAAIAMTKNSGVIVAAVNFERNQYDGHTLPKVLCQTEEIVGKRPEVAICDRGFKGKSKIGSTKIIIPKSPKKKATPYQKSKMRKRFRRRAAIEPVIGHLKSDFRLARNFLKGTIGDTINLLLAAAAYNFKKLMDQLAFFLFLFIFRPFFTKKYQN
ncbi:IS5-like element IS1478 family transposase [Desulfothermus naphthae]